MRFFVVDLAFNCEVWLFKSLKIHPTPSFFLFACFALENKEKVVPMLLFFLPFFFFRASRLKKKYRNFLLPWPWKMRATPITTFFEVREKKPFTCYNLNKTKNKMRGATATKLTKFFQISILSFGHLWVRNTHPQSPPSDIKCLLPITQFADLTSHYLHHLQHLPHCSDSFPAFAHLQFLYKLTLRCESNNPVFSKGDDWSKEWHRGQMVCLRM